MRYSFKRFAITLIKIWAMKTTFCCRFFFFYTKTRVACCVEYVVRIVQICVRFIVRSFNQRIVLRWHSSNVRIYKYRSTLRAVQWRSKDDVDPPNCTSSIFEDSFVFIHENKIACYVLRIWRACASVTLTLRSVQNNFAINFSDVWLTYISNIYRAYKLALIGKINTGTGG